VVAGGWLPLLAYENDEVRLISQRLSDSNWTATVVEVAFYSFTDERRILHVEGIQSYVQNVLVQYENNFAGN
jgi:hypothetical protein